MTAQQVLDRYFLEMRCKVLDVAAALDRIDRAGEPNVSRDDARLANLHKAVHVLLEDNVGRADRVQMIFSDSYDPAWEKPTSGAKK